MLEVGPALLHASEAQLEMDELLAHLAIEDTEQFLFLRFPENRSTEDISLMICRLELRKSLVVLCEQEEGLKKVLREL